MSKNYKTKSSLKLSKILSEVISTPLERVLRILQDLITFLKTIPYYTVDKQNDLQWVINIISNRMIYDYELNNHYEMIDKYKNEFPEFKHLLDSINEYTGTENEIRKFNQLIKKTVKIFENKNDKTSFKELGLQMPSLAYKENKKKKSGKDKNELNIIKNKSDKNDSYDEDNSSSSDDLEKKFMKENMFRSHSFRDLKMNLSLTSPSQTKDKNEKNIRRMTQLNNNNLLKFNKKILDKDSAYEKLVSIKEKESSSSDDESDKDNFSDNGEEEALNKLNFSSSENLDSENSFNNNHQSDDEILLNPDKKKYKNIDNASNISLSAIEKFKENFTTIIAETKLIEKNYDPKNILNKDFDIHEFRKIVGYNNVLPLVGKYIFQKFCLGEKVINTNKLDKFFSSLSNGYIEFTLYHNAIHASDVTQTAALMILNSNFEEIAFTNITDILSIITACLGHPGVNNQFLINTSNELALTYNDLSPLENFHTSNLFKIIKIDENNILDKVSNIVYKSFRKRVINSILATDMVQHGKVLGIIKSKIELSNDKKCLVIKESKNVFEDQQALIDFMIHCCDLAHNAKKFNISLRWVELLSNEFWKQGDKESKDNIPISFLCDRNNFDIPKSQVGFIKAFITPTFEVLVDIFPTLNFFLANAIKNLEEWKKLNEKGRKRGWTPNKESKSRRISKINTDMKIDIFNPKKEKNKLLNKFANDIDINNNYNIIKK